VAPSSAAFAFFCELFARGAAAYYAYSGDRRVVGVEPGEHTLEDPDDAREEAGVQRPDG